MGQSNQHLFRVCVSSYENLKCAKLPISKTSQEKSNIDYNMFKSPTTYIVGQLKLPNFLLQFSAVNYRSKWKFYVLYFRLLTSVIIYFDFICDEFISLNYNACIY